MAERRELEDRTRIFDATATILKRRYVVSITRREAGTRPYSYDYAVAGAFCDATAPMPTPKATTKRMPCGSLQIF
jgi:hypothetical protein